MAAYYVSYKKFTMAFQCQFMPVKFESNLTYPKAISNGRGACDSYKGTLPFPQPTWDSTHTLTPRILAVCDIFIGGPTSDERL